METPPPHMPTITTPVRVIIGKVPVHPVAMSLTDIVMLIDQLDFIASHTELQKADPIKEVLGGSGRVLSSFFGIGSGGSRLNRIPKAEH